MPIDLIALVLLPPALFFAAPAIADTWALIRGLGRREAAPGLRPGTPLPRLLFLVPAHDEEQLIERAVQSLFRQAYPGALFDVVVIADNCSDRTAELARGAGAEVLERSVPARPGKHAALGWALDRLPLDEYAAVVIIDGDTVAEPDFAKAIAAHAPLEGAALQARVGATNEDENWLTLLSAILTVSRWDLALHLKTRAGLNCPLTGDGTVLGTGVLRDHPWDVKTITEGWELYAALTTAGREIRYVPGARIYAQEARDLGQSRSQRERWTAGRLAVLRNHLPAIVSAPGLGLLQRLDLVAELSSVGPILRGFFGVVAATLALAVGSGVGVVAAALFLSPVLLTGVYAALAIPRMREPASAVLAALCMLPLYAAWRVAVGMVGLFRSGTARWVRTARHEEVAAGDEDGVTALR